MVKPKNEHIKNRLYLAVPYSDKAKAYALGAEFDPAAKCWYIDTIKHPVESFKMWEVKALDVTSASMGQSTPTEDFCQFLQARGAALPSGGLIMDGEKHQIPVEGNKARKKSGVYCAFVDHSPAGYFMDYLNDEYHVWRFKGPSRPLEEVRAIRANAHVATLLRHDRRAVAQESVARDCKTFFGLLTPARSDHPYLVDKGITNSFTARQTNDGYLVVPIEDINGKIWGLQTINDQGQKMLKKGQKKLSHLIPIAGNFRSSAMVIVAEGFSTAASIAQSIRVPVVAAIDAHNLDAVVRELQFKNPKLKILVAGDDDFTAELDKDGRTKKNVGEEQTTIAAIRTGITPIYPVIPGERKKFDFNDMFTLLGRDALYNHFLQHIKTHIVPTLGDEYTQSLEIKPLGPLKAKGRGYSQ